MINIEVKIVGSNCKNGNHLYKNLTKVIKSLKDKKIKIIKEDSNSSLQKYNIKNKPGLIIEDKLICEGKVLNEKEIIRILNVVYC